MYVLLMVSAAGSIVLMILLLLFERPRPATWALGLLFGAVALDGIWWGVNGGWGKPGRWLVDGVMAAAVVLCLILALRRRRDIYDALD